MTRAPRRSKGRLGMGVALVGRKNSLDRAPHGPAHRSHMTVLKRVGLIFLALLIILLATIAFLAMTRGTPVHSVLVPGAMGLPPSVSDPLYARTLEMFAKTHIEPGNRVQILRNGNETYPALWKDLRSASRTITLQMYYAMPGALADTLAAVLSERARANVRVMVILDSFGASPIKEEWIKALRGAGVSVEWLRPLHWYSLDKAGNRSHVRAVVVDGRVGYTGG